MMIEETAYVIESVVTVGQSTYRRTHTRVVDRSGCAEFVRWHIDRMGRWSHVEREQRERLERSFLRITGDKTPLIQTTEDA